MKNNWQHIGNKDSMTTAEQCVEKYDKEHPEYEHKTGKPKGKHSYQWQIGLYRKPKEHILSKDCWCNPKKEDYKKKWFGASKRKRDKRRPDEVHKNG